MNNSMQAFIGLAVIVIIGLTAAVIYQRLKRRRVRQVRQWLHQYLCARYGELPQGLTIACSDDHLWPVLVSFDNPRTKLRHRLQFACPGPPSTFGLLAELEERR